MDDGSPLWDRVVIESTNSSIELKVFPNKTCAQDFCRKHQSRFLLMSDAVTKKDSYGNLTLQADFANSWYPSTIEALLKVLNESYDIAIGMPIKEPARALACYRMKSSPRGYCVIINNTTFDDWRVQNLEFGDKDRDAIGNLFGKELKFEVCTHNNLTKEEMERVTTHYSKPEMHDNYDCFVMFILSHGVWHGVCGTDYREERNNAVPLKTIFGPFVGTKCKSLYGKPKIFIVDACRGERKQETAVSKSALGFRSRKDKEETLPNDADFLFAYATVEGCVSFGNTTGSRFIQHFVRAMTELHTQDDIMSILTEVNDRVAKDGTHEEKQMPRPETTLRKKLYWL